MMRKVIALLLVAALALLGAALAETGNADAKEIERFADTWVDDGLAVEIWYDGDEDSIHCHAVLGDGGDMSDVIEYGACRYDGERFEIVCEDGVHTRETYDEATQAMQSEVVASGVTATFRIDADRLIWNDSEGLAGGFALRRLADAEQQDWNEAQAFVGRWVCGRATIDISGESDGGYGVEISWGGSAWESAVWKYKCAYDGAERRMYSYEPGVKSILTYADGGELVSTVVEYEDGEATFAIDGQDLLTWNDGKENAGEGMKFERMTRKPTVAAEEMEQDSAISGKWQVNDDIMAGMTIEKNAGRGWALQIAMAYPETCVLRANIDYDCALDRYVYTDGVVYRSEITNSSGVVIGDEISRDASGSLTPVDAGDGELRLEWRNDQKPDETGCFYRLEDWRDEAEAAEAADSDWYTVVLSDGELIAQYPFHSLVDVNGDSVPALIVSTTEKSFIGAEDSARVYLCREGEIQQALEVGQGGGDVLFCNRDEHTLTHYSRLSGEAHIEVFRVEDGALTPVMTADAYQPHHSPESDNADTLCYQDGEAISEADCDALFDRYAGEADAITYEKTE